ncbi:S-layer homology domain-containing protein [Candidatus Gracilibacteria bacterium]|nr:S-layer homology domain-containing protein [Candidatus Gracilibacteria bacterium]
MKKWGVALMFCFLPFSLAQSAVNPDDPQSSILQHLDDIGVMSSDPNPDQLMTRAEALVVALRLGGIQIPEYKGQSFFSDTDPNQWYAPVVARAVETDILNTTHTHFRPHDAITKAEFLTLLFRATQVNLNQYTYKTNNIAQDIPEDAWFAPIFAYAKRYQIAELPSDQFYRPFETLTRRRAAIMAFRTERLFYGNAATKVFVELEAEIKQFITLLKAGDSDQAEFHLQRIIDLNDQLVLMRNNEEAVAANAVSRALTHFSESLRSFKFGNNLAALESLHLAAKQADRALKKSEVLAPFARDLSLLIEETLLSFTSPASSLFSQKGSFQVPSFSKFCGSGDEEFSL